MSTASRQVWNWREDTPERRREELAARLRHRGLVGGLVALAVGTLLNKVFGHAILGRVIVLLGAFQALVALWRPLLLAGPLRWLVRFGEAVGTGLSWLLLTLLWSLVFVPAGVVLRLRRRDPLHRARLAPGLTAWIPRRRQPEAESFARQFLVEDPGAHDLDRPESTLPDPGLVAGTEADGESAP